MAKKTISIVTSNGRRDVEADVFGQWAVHVGQWAVHVGDTWLHSTRGTPRLQWAVTNTETGLRLNLSETTGISKRNAIKLARHLGRHVECPRAMALRLIRFAQNETPLRELPADVLEWTRSIYVAMCDGLGVEKVRLRTFDSLISDARSREGVTR